MIGLSNREISKSWWAPLTEKEKKLFNDPNLNSALKFWTAATSNEGLAAAIAKAKSKKAQ